MKHLSKIPTAALAAAALLGGCASHAPVTLALTDLGSASKMEYGADHLRFMRAVTIHGLGGEEVVGMLTKDPDPSVIGWEWLQNYLRIGSKDMPDSLAPRIANTCSKVVEIVFDNDEQAADPRKIASIRDQLLGVERGVAEQLRVEVDLLLLDGLAARMKAPGADAAAALAEFEATWPRLGVKDEAALAKARADKIKELDTLRAEADARKQQLDKALATPGIVVTRWTRERKSSFSLATAVGSGGASRQREVNGYLILGAPRITTLMIGDDLVHRLAGKRPDDDDSPPNGALQDYFVARRMYTSIYQLRAKTLAYAESQTEALTASLQADLKLASEKLSLIAAMPGGKIGNLLEGLDAKVRAELARATDLGTSGMVHAAKINLYEFRFHRNDAYAESVRAELARANGYRPVYSARTTLDRLKDQAQAPASLSAACTRPVNLANNLLDLETSPVAMSHVEKLAERLTKQAIGSDTPMVFTAGSQR